MRSKIIAIFVSFCFLFDSTVWAAASAANVNVNCEMVSQEDYQRVGDIDAKEIYTKTDYLYECTTTTEKRGACNEWESQREDYNIFERPKIAYKDENFNGTTGQMFNIVNAFNGLPYVWGGWKGICTDGTVTDFGWAEDPLFWASIVMQAYGGDLMGDAGGTIGGETGAFIAEYGSCIATAGIDSGRALQDYYSDNEVPCDPIDEFCGPSEDSYTSSDKIISIDQQQWDDALAQSPELANYTEIISSDNGILLVRFDENYDAIGGESDAAAQKAAQKAKDMKLAFDAVGIASSAATCMYGDNHSSTAASTGGGNGGLVNSGAQLLLSFMGVAPVVGAVLAVVISLAQSFDSINTCNNKKDAEERGARHLKTFTHKPYGMCHLYRKEDIGGDMFSDDYTNYHYCCYPDIVSRILVEQIKAQLARGWAHCTDITFQDIEKINFQSCTDSQIHDPGTIDGKNVEWDATQSERERAYQFKHKCIDYTDYNKYLIDKLEVQDVDNYNFEEQLNGIQKNEFEVENENIETPTSTQGTNP